MIPEKTRKFVDKAIIIHGNVYDYSLVNYVNNRTNVKIICKKHGIFEQTPSNHLSNKQCANCTGNKKLTTEEFICEAKKIHGDTYEYSESLYEGANKKLRIKCKIHGLFEQIPHSHLKGYGCKFCKNIKISKTLTSTTEEFINKAKEIHGNTYDYSTSKYLNANKKISISCSIHGKFVQTPNSHLNGMGCPTCGNLKKWEKRRITTEEFINKAKEIHGNTYDYSLSKYNKNTDIIEIKCSKHGIFLQKAHNHLRGCGCPSCKLSRGEFIIEKILNEYKINYIKQKRFNDCRNKLPLPFDFYLPEYNYCIEYDGAYHFKPIKNRGGMVAFYKVKNNDKIKTDYCNKNKISLFRVSSKTKIQEFFKNNFNILITDFSYL